MNLRSGQRWHTTTTNYKQRCKLANLTCWLCHQPINYLATGTPDSFATDHYYPVSQRPDLIYVEAFFRPSHKLCNDTRGNKPPEPEQQPWIAADW